MGFCMPWYTQVWGEEEDRPGKWTFVWHGTYRFGRTRKTEKLTFVWHNTYRFGGTKKTDLGNGLLSDIVHTDGAYRFGEARKTDQGNVLLPDMVHTDQNFFLCLKRYVQVWGHKEDRSRKWTFVWHGAYRFGRTRKTEQGNGLLSDMVHTCLGGRGREIKEMDFCLTWYIQVWVDKENRTMIWTFVWQTYWFGRTKKTD